MLCKPYGYWLAGLFKFLEDSFVRIFQIQLESKTRRQQANDADSTFLVRLGNERGSQRSIADEMKNGIKMLALLLHYYSALRHP